MKVHMRPPVGFRHSPNKESSGRLCQALYEIWQASRAWFVKFSSSTISQFEYSTTFYNSTLIINLFDVQTMHGIIQKWWFAGYSGAQAIPQSTIRRIKMKDLGLFNYFLGSWGFLISLNIVVGARFAAQAQSVWDIGLVSQVQ